MIPTPSSVPGHSTYEIEHDINLVREVITLSFPWKLRVHCFKGRLRDSEGRPNLYPPGTTIKYELFAAPPWSDAAQHAIIISQGAQRVKIAIRCPLPGVGAEPATVVTIIRFEVTDGLGGARYLGPPQRMGGTRHLRRGGIGRQAAGQFPLLQP